MTRSPTPYALVERLEQLEPLDAPADAVADAVDELVSREPVKDVLSGTWLGHAVHPLVMVLPLGTWTSAVLLDWLGGADAARAADRLIGMGLLSVPPTVATGVSDWVDTKGGARRVGLVHAASNATGTMLFAASLVARRAGARGRGKLLALAGMGAVTVGGYLGGHLSYARGIGVDQTAFEPLPGEWTRALDAGALPEGELRCAEADGTPILLARRDGAVYALADRCSHRGGPLHEGTLHDGCVTCPLHGSTFRLEDGSVARGPAAYPQPALDARERDGGIEVRARSR